VGRRRDDTIRVRRQERARDEIGRPRELRARAERDVRAPRRAIGEARCLDLNVTMNVGRALL